MKSSTKAKVSRKQVVDPQPEAYDTLYYDFEHIEDEQSDSEVSEIESEVSEKNEQEHNLREVEEMNNKYSFIKDTTPGKKKNSNKKTEELKEEEYI